MKTYKISDECTLELRQLMTDDVLAVLRIIQKVDSAAGKNKSVLDFITNSITTGTIDELIKIALKGDFPKGKPGTWLPLETALEVAEDFLDSNKLLAKRFQPLLAIFKIMNPEALPSLPVDTKTKSETFTKSK